MGDRDVGKLPTLMELAGEPLFGAELGVGAQVGPYVIEARGGRGGFATVYRARHYREGGPPVAVKVLHDALAHSSRMLLRFEREVEMLRRVRHPTIVEVIDYGSLPDGRPFYVMPWIEGTPLDELLKAHGAFSVEEIVAMFTDVIDALRIAHAAGVVHRDIKPANLIATPEGALRLLDFGIAKIVSDDVTGRHDLTSTGNRIGTPHYMAPEQIAGRAIDPRTDVYALGVMLFQLVTGRLPFSASSPLEVEAHHLYTPPPRPSLTSSVPAGFDEVVLRCMAKRLEERFDGVGELWDALRAVTAGARSIPGEEVESVVVGIHVEATIVDDTSEEASDAAFDELADLLDRARERCETAGVELVATGGRSFVAALPAKHDLAEAVDLAMGLVAMATAQVRLTATIHRAPVLRRAGEIVGGDLLRLVEWIVAPVATGVWVTDPAVSAIAEHFELDAGTTSARRVRERRRRP
jgi:eukaryotic-like serine/threonine-protein kinase